MRLWIWGLLACWCLPLLAVDPLPRPESTPPRVVDVKPKRLPQPGDLEHILQKKELRALVVYERGFFFFDKGAQYGILVNQLQGFERWLNKTYLAKEKLKLKIIYIPVRQDKLLDYLTEGRGDLVAATMTVTPTRREQVTFSAPIISPIEEWVVSQRALPGFNRITQLSGRRIWVRASSSYYESLHQLNWLFRELGLPPVYIETVPEYLQDGDLMEMVAAGIIPLTVTDSFKGRIWLDMIGGLKAHKLIPLRDKGRSAWALRNNSPELLKAVNAYISESSKRTLYSDMTLRRLLAQSEQMSNILAPDPLGRLSTIRKVLEAQAAKYRLDWLMLAALGYKESGLNPNVGSHGGAVGIMQLLPSTGGVVGIRGARLSSLEGNVEAACRYLRHILDTYFNDPGMDNINRHLFALAAYNAGPNRVQALQVKAKERGLDPNVWFGNVEQLVANEVGQGPINYVGTIYKYYVAYRFSLPQLEGKSEAISDAKEAVQP
ncbi:MltF family protein [Aeromonas aquatica]|uniref:transglycosylase SLT domain-containing protein n=1 Tax=Aeromonas aquatica TaxID=558964 RepID=UPI00286F4B23|nr:lytic transglycosylase F [Aeromonas aquatica]